MARNIKQNAGMAVIKLSRKAFVNTPIQKWKITAALYRKIFHLSHGTQEKLVTYKGAKFYLPGTDTQIVPSIVGGYFESLELDVFKKIASESKVFVDVGGNIGIYTVLAMKSNPALKIFAFEPIDSNINLFNKNVSLNTTSQKPQVTLIPKAIGAVEGLLEIYISEANSAIHSASKKHSQGNQSVKISMTSIDAYCQKQSLKPDLLKIDIEGYDGFALDGAEKTLQKHKPSLFIEYDPRALADCGYEPKKFIKTLCSVYENAFIFDEKTQLISQVAKKELLSTKVYSNMNLLFSNNPQHLKVIREF